ncbi:opioid growth factor receptor conserved domain-containing protein, partial [Protomyces lactucae-debilis]
SNVRFYLQGLPCRPDNLTIDELILKWRGQYNVLEDRHGYIQWLFPLRQQGVNPYASALLQQEVDILSTSREAQCRMLSALDMMLDFYGMRWQDQKLRQLGRTSSYKVRYCNLMNHTHNFLRISRILQSLCLFGLSSYTTPIVLYLLSEVCAKELGSPGLFRSLKTFWIECL